MKVKMKSFAKATISIPDHPEVKCIIAIPLKTIFENRKACENANIYRVVYDLNEQTPYRIYH